MANQEIEGLSVRADMEGSSLKQGLQGLNAQLKSVKSEFTLAQAGVKGFSDSLDGMRAKSENLQKQINVQSQIVENLRKAYERSQTAITNTVNKQNELRQAMTNNRTQYEEAIRLHGEESQQAQELATAYQRLERQYDQNQTALNRNNTAMANTQTRLNNAQATLRSMESELSNTNTAIARQSSEWQQLSNQLRTAGEQINKIGDGMVSLGETVTKSVTVPLTALGAAAIAAFSEVDEAQEMIVKATGATGETLDKMNDVFSNVAGTIAGDLNDIGGAIGEINTRFKFTDKALEDASVAFMKFSTITNTDVVEGVRLISRYMGDAGVASEEYGKVLDSVAKTSQDTGIGTSKLLESLTSYGAPMRALGLDIEESIALLGQWELSGVNMEIAMSGMKKAIGTWGKSGKDATEEFKKTLEEIKNYKTIAEATTKAIEVFGQKAGPDLADAIQGGRFEIEALFESINSSKGTLDGTFANIADEQDEYQIALNQSKIALSGLGEEILINTAPIVKDFTALVKDCGEWFASLDDSTKQSIVRFGLLAAAVGPFAFALGKVISAGGSAVKTISSLSAKIAGAGGLKAALVAIPTPASAAVIALAAISTALILWKKSADEAREAQEKALEQARAYTETSKALDTLKERYKEVNQLQEDDKTKKEQLKAIQEELIDTYGIEASSIDVVNGKYSEQIDLIEKLKNRKREDAEITFGQELINSKNELNELAKSSWFSAGSGKLGGNENLEAWKRSLSEISEEYKSLVEVSSYNSNGLQMQFDSKDAEKYKDLLGEIILNARKYGVDNTGLYDKLYTEWSNLSGAIENYSKAQYEAFSFDFGNQLGDIKKNLGLEDVTEYTQEQADKIEKAFSDSMQTSDQEYKKFAENMLKSLPIVGKSLNENLNTKGAADNLGDLEEESNSLAKTIEDISNKVKTYSDKMDELEKVIQKVKAGNELSSAEIINLVKQYPELEARIDSTTGKYTFEISALEKLKNGLTTSTKQQLENESAKTKQVMTQTQARIKLYLQEMQAQQALAGLKFNDDGSIQDSGAFTYKMSQSKELQDMYNEYTNKAEAFKKIQQEIKNMDITTTNLGAGSSSSSSKSTESPLDKALESFEKSKKIRAIGLNEEMAQLEKIKSAYAKTAEEKVDIEEYMYNNYLDIMERKRSLGQLSYDNEIKMYEQALSKYTFNEYQKAEVSSKLLDTKIEHSKAWIEQEKYYGRLSLEEEKKAYERIAEYSKQSAEYKKEMAKEIYRIENELKEQQEELEKEKQEAVKKTVEANIKAKEEEYNKTIAMIDDECNRKVEAYQAQIDALQEQYDKEEELQKQKEYDEKIADLEERMKGARTQEEFEKLAEELNNTQQAKRDYTRQQQLKSDKALLQDKIDQAKNEATIAKNVEKEKLDTYKETQNKMLEEATRTETNITEVLKKQLTERETAFISSLQVMLTAYAGFKASMGGVGGLGGIASSISGITLAAASNKLQTTAASNSYSKSTYNNNTTNANVNMTNIIKNAADANTFINMFNNYIKGLNRAKGVT